MIISGKTIKAQAIVDMNWWILNFKASDTAQEYSVEEKETYMKEIEKIKLRLLKER